MDKCLRESSDGIRIAVHLFLTAILLASSRALSAQAPPANLPGEEVDLQSVPELQGAVKGEFWQPSAVDLLDNLRRHTGLNLTLDESVIRDRPIQGYTKYDAPAWGAMEGLAENKYVRGRWRKIGNEYRLFATYKGPPPPIPRKVPPEVLTAIKNDTELKFEKPPQPAANDTSTSNFSRAWRIALLGGALILALLGVRWTLRRLRGEDKKTTDATAS